MSKRSLSTLVQRDPQLLQQYQKLEAENLNLKECIARLEKNSALSSKPLSCDNIPPQTAIVEKKKRPRGGQPGHSKHRR